LNAATTHEGTANKKIRFEPPRRIGKKRGRRGDLNEEKKKKRIGEKKSGTDANLPDGHA
jgi:hypothetical protein